MDINQITYAINGAIFEVNRILGPGFLEKVYENALLVELKKRGLQAESQAPIKVEYKQETVGEYFADILVEGTVVIELKTVESLDKAHEAQLLNYCIRKLPEVGIAETEKFAPGYYYCALARNLQILGAFSHLSKIKKKNHFEEYIPCAVKTLDYNLNTFKDTNFPKLKKIAEKLVSKEVFNGNSKSNG